MVIVAAVIGVILGLVVVILVGFFVHRYRSKAKIMRQRARDTGMTENAFVAEPTRRVAAPLRDDINMDVVEKVLQTSI